MLTRKQIINHLRICALKHVNKGVLNDVIMPIDSGFEALSNGEQIVLTLMYMSSPAWKAQEVADEYGVSRSTIYRIRNRALDILQYVLDDEYLQYNNLGKASEKVIAK